MEVLQPILNVLTIATVTTLSVVCYLEKRVNRELAAKLDAAGKKEDQSQSQPQASADSAVDNHRAVSRQTVSQQTIAKTGTSQVIPRLVTSDDIRQFVAQRTNQWAEITVPVEDFPSAN